MDKIKIRKEIEELEEAETTWSNVQRLAALYSVYDHLADEGVPVLAQAMVTVMPDELGIGEFEEACAGKQILPLIDILSEHMAVAKTLYPKEYAAVIRKIEDAP